MSDAPPAAPARRARVAVSLGFGAQGFVFATILTSLIVFTRAPYDLDELAISIVVLGVCLMAGVGTYLSDRIARTPAGSGAVLLRGLVVVATAVAIVALSPDFPARVAGERGPLVVALVGFAVFGLGVGMVDSGTNMQAVSIQRAYGRSLLTGFYASWSVGGILGTLMVAVASGRVPTAPVGWTFLVGTAAALAAAVAVRRDAWHEPAVVVDEAAPSDVKPEIPWGPLLVLGLGVVAYYVNDQAIVTWSPLFMDDVLHQDGTITKVGYAVYLATALLSRLAGDPLVRRWGRIRVVRGAALVGAAGILVVLTARGPEQAVVGFGLAGAGLGLIAPLCFSSAGLLAPGHADAVVARLNGFNYLGAVLGGVFVGLIGSASSLRWGWLVPLVLVLAVAVLAGRFGVVRHHEKAPLSAGAGA